jgi:two-component system response regulator NreC
MFREVIRKACGAEFGHKVVGATDSGVEAIKMIRKLKPEAVVLDLSLPDVDGFTVIDRVLAVSPDVRILVLSSLCDDYTLFRVERAGVHGFIDKNTNTVEALRNALAAIGQGQIYFSAAFQEARLARRADPQSFTKILSERERAILSLIGQGLSDEEIAERLSVSGRTVQSHRSNILRKLGLKNTPKLIAFAIEHGFTQIPAKHGTLPIYT